MSEILTDGTCARCRCFVGEAIGHVCLVQDSATTHAPMHIHLIDETVTLHEELAALRAEVALLKQERGFARKVDPDTVEVAALRERLEYFTVKRENDKTAIAALRERVALLEQERAAGQYEGDLLRAEVERLRHELADAHGVAQACEARAEKAERGYLSVQGLYKEAHSMFKAAEARAEKAERELAAVTQDRDDWRAVADGRALQREKARAEKYRASFENETVVRREWATRAEKLAAALREIAFDWPDGKNRWADAAEIAARALAEIERKDKP